jgi:hypothetical protein
MKSKTLLTLLVLVALIGLSTTALSAETKKVKTNASNKTLARSIFPDVNIVKIGQTSSANLKVPISIINNSTKEVWTSPGKIPACVFAGITNNGNLSLSVYAISLNPDTGERVPQFAGIAKPRGDGVIVFGKYIALELRCENSSSLQYCNGTIDTVSAFPE